MVTVDPSSLGPASQQRPSRDWPSAPLERIGSYRLELVLSGDEANPVCLGRDARGDAVEVHLLRRPDAAELIEPLRDLVEAFEEARHPNLVGLLDAGADPQTAGVAYLVTGHVAGCTLAEVIASATGPLATERVVRWADQLAGALDCLHDHGLVHGALDPDAVIIDHADEAHLRGAGIAVELARLDPRRAEQEILLGEGAGPDAAPEIADPADDIAALAAVVYEALGGSRAEGGGGPLPVPGRSVQINMALLAAMSDDPAARPLRARELVQSLHGAPLRQAFVMPEAPPRRRRIGAGALVAALAVGAMVLGAWLWHRQVAAPSMPVAAALEVEAPPPEAGRGAEPDVAQPAAAGEPLDLRVETMPSLRPDEGLAQRAARVRQSAAERGMDGDPAATALLQAADRLLQQARAYEGQGRREAADAAYLAVIDACQQAVAGHVVQSALSAASSWLEEQVGRARLTAASRPPQPGDEQVDSIGMRLVFVGPGEFVMGSSAAEPGRDRGELLRRVRLSEGFWIGRTEVTRGQFATFVAETGYGTAAERAGWSHGLESDGEWRRIEGLGWRNPGFAQGDDHPVVCVSLDDALAFCEWLGSREGRAYALPTEAQWEFACRAGATTAWHWGDGLPPEAAANVADATWSDRFGGAERPSFRDGFLYTSPVGRFTSNAWGIHDVHGNAAEWCADRFAEYDPGALLDPVGPPPVRGREDRSPWVVRGGSYASPPSASRCAHRDASPRQLHFATLGFRVVMEP
jgi:formylglycine-generating enzyme required for sulfatase activity